MPIWLVTAGDRQAGEATEDMETHRPDAPLPGVRAASRGTARPSGASGSSFAVRQGRIEMFGRGLDLPAQRRWRISIGVALIVGGVLGFLPILGFWMVPLGLLVLSIDIAVVRRMRRRSAVKWKRRRGYGRREPAPGLTAASLVDAAHR